MDGGGSAKHGARAERGFKKLVSVLVSWFEIPLILMATTAAGITLRFCGQ